MAYDDDALQSTPTLAEIREALKRPEWQVRVAAMQHLVRFGEHIPIPLLAQALMDKHKRVRVATLEACADLAPHIPVALVNAALLDPQWSVRAAAAWALGHFAARAPRPRLLALLHDPLEDPLVRASALHALASLDEQVFLTESLAALHDPQWPLREVAALSLGHLRVLDAIEPLVEALRDPEPPVRAAAASSLGKISKQVPPKVLITLLADKDAAVCEAAAWALGELAEPAEHEYVAPSRSVYHRRERPPDISQNQKKPVTLVPPGVSVRRHRDGEFIPIEPADLHTVPIIFQALDNQWLPRSLLSPMIKGKLTYQHVTKYLTQLVRTEYIQALLTCKQLVINRAYLYNNPVIAKDYATDQPDRTAFKELLRLGVIVPVLFTEQSPADVPDYGIRAETFAAWQQICREVRMLCLRCSWNDTLNQQLTEQKLTQRFHTFVLKAYTGDAGTYERKPGLKPGTGHLLKNRLYQVAQACMMAIGESKTGFIARDMLYKLFVTVGDNPAERVYTTRSDDSEKMESNEEQEKLYAGEIKQLLDLAYNSYLADALHGYLRTPVDSLTPLALQEWGAIASNAQAVTAQYLIAMLHHVVFPPDTQEIGLQSLAILRLREVVALRETGEWSAYSTNIERLRQKPQEFARLATKVYSSFLALNHRMIALVQKRTTGNRPLTREQTFVPELRVNIGEATISIHWRNGHPSYVLAGEEQPGMLVNQIVPVTAQLNINTWRKADNHIDQFISHDFLFGKMDMAQQEYAELINHLRDDLDRE